MPYRFITADIFTDRLFGGNQLAVLPDARGLTGEQMQAITREFNYSETTFVLPPERGGTRRVRIFTPGAEVPFAGHPTIGTAHVLAAIGDLVLTGDEMHVLLEEGVGDVPVTIRASNGVPTFAQLSVARLPQVVMPASAIPDAPGLAELLSLSPDDLVGGPWSAEAVSCGLPFLIVPLKTRDALRRARVRMDPWERALAGTPGSEILCFALDAEPGYDLQARVFVPGLSVPEDPATGSANAALGGYLAVRTPREGTLRWTVAQGVEMGRPSRLEVEVDKSGGAVTAVRVGGASVLVSEGTLRV